MIFRKASTTIFSSPALKQGLGLAPSRTLSSPSYLRRFEGKVAILSGSTEGIGFASAKRLAEEGCSVVVSSRKQENVTKAVASLKEMGHENVLGVRCHVGSEEERQKLVDQTVKHFGGVDILVNTAGVNPAPGETMKCDEGKWKKMIDINVLAPYFLSELVVPEMKKKKQGSIINIGSISSITPIPFVGAYGVSKTGLVMMTKQMAMELGKHNIRVNVITAGLIDTAFAHGVQGDSGIQDHFKKLFLGRIGAVDEISGIVSFLASSDAGYITGEAISACGGLPYEFGK